MKQLVILLFLGLQTISIIQTAVSPKILPKTQSLVIPIAYEISIINTSNIPAKLTGLTVKYSQSEQSQTKPSQTITAKANNIIPANKGISFTPQIILKTKQPDIATQFEGVTQLMINSQTVSLAEPNMALSPLYIANINGKWQIIKKPVPKTSDKQGITNKSKNMFNVMQPKTLQNPVNKIPSLQSTAVPYINTVHPKTSTALPNTKTVAHVDTLPTIKATKPLSQAGQSSAKAINATLKLKNL